MVVVRSHVFSIKDPLIFKLRKLPKFIDQDPSSKALQRFARHLEEVLSLEYPNSLSKVVAIQRWVRYQQPQDENLWMKAEVNHEDPDRLLEEQRRGVPGSCRRFSYILLGALLSAGFDARIVVFLNALHRRNPQGHAAVEVWIDELHQWVLLDPTFDTLVVVNGKLASAIDLQEAIARGDFSRIEFERDDAALAPHPTPEAYGRFCRHLFVGMSNAVFDGYGVRIAGPRRIHFLHYNSETAYPEFRKQILLGAGGTGLFLSFVLWVWSVVAFINN
jgi:hypothetical protein